LRINFNGYFFAEEKNNLYFALKVFEEYFTIDDTFILDLHSIDKQFSKELNRIHFKKNYSTDVITLPIFDNLNSIKNFPNENEMIIGDIFFCREIVKSNAKKYKKSLIEELQLVLVHGLLHLLGFSHEKETKLKFYENKILKKLWNEQS